MLEYVIRWSCKECGNNGEIRGDSKYEAWKKFEPMLEEHDKHSNVLWIEEGYERSERTV